MFQKKIFCKITKNSNIRNYFAQKKSKNINFHFSAFILWLRQHFSRPKTPGHTCSIATHSKIVARLSCEGRATYHLGLIA